MLFVDFYYLLRDLKVPVSITEFLSVCEALDRGLIHDLDTLYHVGRSLMVKDEKWFDHFDQAFAFAFADGAVPERLREEILNWLRDPAGELTLTPEELAALEALGWDELREAFEERLRNQKERHDGGDRHVGTGGRSPFGHSGANPRGIRVGGSGRSRSAVQVALKRRFQNYRHDVVLDTRSIKVALKKLRKLSRVGAPEELNLDKTVDETCRNGGEIELVFEPRKKNNLKLLLLMDAGGSMEPYSRLVSRLFSAAHASTHFKDFRYYYFHNCVYENVYEDVAQEKLVPTASLFRKFDEKYRAIFVGDAAMAPWELTRAGGSIYYYHYNETPGIVWLRRFREHYPKSVWLNPDIRPDEPDPYWGRETRDMIKRIFPMFPLTLEGLNDAIKTLI
ncbi:MAG: VWA domain-containing protein [Promethearchaeota archaeon]